MTLDVHQEEDSIIYLNGNDEIGRIEIYDAAAHVGTDAVYEATFNFHIGASKPFIKLPCTYDVRSDRLIVDTKEAPKSDLLDFRMV